MGSPKPSLKNERKLLGDPIEIFVRGYELTIRKEDALLIEVE